MNSFCTASYFCAEHHHGKLVNISLTKPKDYDTIESFSELIPSPDIVKYWKDAVKSFKVKGITRTELNERWSNYSASYTRSLNRRIGGVKIKLNQLLNSGQVFTLLCWEKPSAAIPNCHRDIAGQWLESNFELKWHQDTDSNIAVKNPPIIEISKTGAYVSTLDYIEWVKHEFAKKDVSIDFISIPDDPEFVTDEFGKLLQDDSGALIQVEKAYLEEPGLFNIIVNSSSWGLWTKSGLGAVVEQIKRSEKIVFEVAKS